MFGSVLSSDAQRALAVLASNATIKNGYLAGGSALALWYGHRYSVDFDFFSDTPFDTYALNQELKKLGLFREELVREKTLLGTFNSIKFSYFYYPYALLEKPELFQGVSIARPHDIAAMKLVAITDRGTKKDYVDLYTLIKQGVPFNTMFALYEQKYHLLDSNRFTLIQALQYFDEADQTEMPKMTTSVSWDEVKQFLTKELIRLGKSLLTNP